MVEMIEGSLEKMLEITNLKPTECSCGVCQKRCSESICLGTPDDILGLMNAGYVGLMHEMSVDVVLVHHREVMPIRMVQLIRDDNGCALYKDGKCLVHDLRLKPSEGRYFIHPKDRQDETIMHLLTLTIAMEWAREANMPKVDQCFRKLPF